MATRFLVGGADIPLFQQLSIMQGWTTSTLRAQHKLLASAAATTRERFFAPPTHQERAIVFQTQRTVTFFQFARENQMETNQIFVGVIKSDATGSYAARPAETHRMNIQTAAISYSTAHKAFEMAGLAVLIRLIA